MNNWRFSRALGSRWVVAAGLFASFGSLYACSGDDAAESTQSAAAASGSTSGGPTDNFDRKGLLTSLADKVLIPSHAAFAVAAGELDAAVKLYAGSLDDADKAAAQEAWRKAMNLWQRAELFQIGPAGSAATVIAGQGIRDQIYSWPMSNTCRIDQEIVEKAYEDPTAFAAELTEVRGLDTLEYLLFYEGTTNACGVQNDINLTGAWDAIPEAELVARRATYAVTLTGMVAERAAALRDEWEPSGKDFRAQLVGAGEGSTTYATTQEALNAVSNAMFYLESETKDMKLAVPAGVAGCLEATCPGDLESLWAAVSKPNIVQNLRGFQDIFLGAPAGTEGLGFDDYLVAKGAESLSATMASDIEAALAAAEAIEEDTLAEALSADPASVVALFNAVQAITDTLKTQFIAVLDLDLPKNFDGDSD